jgi:DNA-directed RNA polymerase specialized sigma24 family protein
VLTPPLPARPNQPIQKEEIMNIEEFDHLATKARIAKRKSFEQLKKEKTKLELEAAYSQFIAEPETHEREFFERVRKYVASKVRSRHWDRTCSGKTQDDHVQTIMFDVFKGLETTNVRNFYAWLQRLVFRQAWNSAFENEQHNETFVPFLIDAENEDGEVKETINPLVFQKLTVVTRRKPQPVWIEKGSVDEKIFQYVGVHSYSKIAQILSMSLSAVNHRASRMRARMVAEAMVQNTRLAVKHAAENARHVGRYITKRAAIAARIEKMTAFRD